MKKTKKVLGAVLCLVSMTCGAFGLSACEHEHAYSKDWAKDEEQHWHECMVKDCDKKDSEEAHDWGNWVNDSRTCKVCEYTQTREHTHSYGTEFSKDGTNHWLECLGEGCNEKDFIKAHTWGNWVFASANDSRTCEICSYVETRQHEHSYGTVWGKGSEGHWHECIVTDCNGKDGVKPHDWTEWDNDIRTCKDCGYEETKHDHNWGTGWTVTEANKPTATSTGKATRTCGNAGCDATASEKEHELPALTSTDYTLSNNTATCIAAGTATYAYSKDGVTVSFTAATPVKADAHNYGDTYVNTDPAGHYYVCSYNQEHTTEKEDHNENGTNGACTVCGYSATGHSHNWGTGWTVTEANKPTATEAGKATRTCVNADCDAELSDKEYELPVLTSTAYTKTTDTATCMQEGSITYTYSNTDDKISVSFVVETPVNANAHNYGESYTYTDHTGHWQVCANNSAHTTEKEDHNENGTNGACSECGYKHNHNWGDGWTVTEANKPTATEEGKATRTCSVAGCNAGAEDKEYTLPVLTSEDYDVTTVEATIEAAGEATYTYNKNDVEVSFTVTLPMLESMNFTITVEGEVEGVTVKLGQYTATTNAQGVATVKAEKQDYAVVIENTETGVDGEHTYTYTAAQITVAAPTATLTLPTRCIGGADPTDVDEGETYNYVTLSGGLYYTVIQAVPDPLAGADHYKVVEQWFGIPCNEAKKYTIKILTGLTSVSSQEAGYEMIDSEESGVGVSYSIVMEEGDFTVFNIISNHENPEEGEEFEYCVVFEISVTDPPEIGVKERPIRTEEGQNGKANVSEGEKVYFRLDYATFSKYAKVTFGDDVSVYLLGLSKQDTGSVVANGAKLTLSEYNYTYLYATSTGTDCYIDLQITYNDGMKQLPHIVTVGTDAPNTVKLHTGDREAMEQWYKLTVEEDGTYIIVPSELHAWLEIYEDVDAEYIKLGRGSAIAVNLKADIPVYIRAASTSNVGYSFTVTEMGAEYEGMTSDNPSELTESDEYTLYESAHYYTYTPNVSSKVTLNYDGGEVEEGTRVNGYAYFTVYTDAAYTEYLTILVYGAHSVGKGQFVTEWYQETVSSRSDNTVTFYAEAGVTYYIMTDSADAKNNTFTFTVEELEEYDFVITVLNGSDAQEGVTVTVKNGDEVVTSGETSAEGKVTLSLIPSNYTFVLTAGVPEGYKADEVSIVINDLVNYYKPDENGVVSISMSIKRDIDTSNAKVGATSSSTVNSAISTTYALSEGTNVIDLSSNSVLYYNFITKDLIGKYRITVTNITTTGVYVSTAGFDALRNRISDATGTYGSNQQTLDGSANVYSFEVNATNWNYLVLGFTCATKGYALVEITPVSE